MKKDSLFAGSILILALALTLNAIALLAGKRSDAPSLLPAASAQNNNNTIVPPITYLGRDTYFLTGSSDGRNVYLWYYDYSANQDDNKVYLVKSASANK